MSILLIEIVPQGMIFGADRNISERTQYSTPDGKTVIHNYGQSQRSKIFRWPKPQILVGYVGLSEIGMKPSDEWLLDFIGNSPKWNTLKELAESLSHSVEKQLKFDGGETRLLIIMLGGFEERDGVMLPLLYEIRNYHAAGPKTYDDIRKEFAFIEVKWPVKNKELKDWIKQYADQYEPYWVHQGEDLGTFNAIEAMLRGAFRVLCSQQHPEHNFPQTLSDWERQVRMAVLTYGAYFQAYKGPHEQLVGGGADILSLEWP